MSLVEHRTDFCREQAVRTQVTKPQRRPHPRWAAPTHRRLTGQRTLANIGAGAGSYQPGFLNVVAVEPSRVMIGQRSLLAAPAICASAENLPFDNLSFDVAGPGRLDFRNWTDAAAGLAEMRWVTRRQVVVTWG